MRVDLYQRTEPEGHFSYLAVPEGEVIPDEVVSIDWRDLARGLELVDQQASSDYGIDQPQQQIDEKGYAITALRRRSEKT